MNVTTDTQSPAAGTYIFDGRMAMKGYNLNRMCYSFNSADNRRKFKAFPEAYCHAFNLTREQMHAVTDLDVLRMLRLGGNIHYIAKLTGIYDMDVHDLGAQQAQLSVHDFRVRLATQGC